jgi:hypothetical protein
VQVSPVGLIDMRRYSCPNLVLGVFALAYGVVADIASPAERGGYVGVVSFWSDVLHNCPIFTE